MTTSTDRLSHYTDDALRAKIAEDEALGLRGFVRSNKALLEILSDPAERVEAADRQIGLMNRLNMRASDAMRHAALAVRDGAPRFTDEYHPNGPTA